MSEGLFLIDSDNVPVRMEPRESEDEFQALLAKFPELLTDSDFGEGSPRRRLREIVAGVAKELSKPEAVAQGQ